MVRWTKISVGNFSPRTSSSRTKTPVTIHTNVRFISCDGHQLYKRGVDLEVEGVRYIEMHRGPNTYSDPPPSRGRDLELEGGVNACHVEYVYESRDSHVRGTE